jgi:UTP--glucose-1-phosphate uridylyltransferase
VKATMSEAGLRAAQEKMRAADVAPAAIEVFSHYYRQLEEGATGLIGEESISPLRDPFRLADVQVDEEAAREALASTVIVKLNGGLGTSMGLDRAKTLLPVRDGRTFLDLIVAQVRHARRAWGAPLPLLFMDSFRTHEDTLHALEPYPDLAVDGFPLDFLQNQEPKLLAEDLTPVSWPADPSLEWCPPGHGDLYSAILASGALAALVDRGYRYAIVSNADNLGAAPDARLAGWFAQSGAPYASEVCRRTPADRKGGHLAVRRSDGRLILRESAQTSPEDMDAFTDEKRHAYFNTNTMWIDLRAVHEALTQRGPVLGLPLIRNTKTVDPTDPRSPKVIQIETAMGAAIEVFDGATAIEVGRDRFLPVKTTNDLLLLRSDAYRLGDEGVPRLVAQEAPLVDLDPRYYRTIGDFDARFPDGPPSLRSAVSLHVRGDWTFEARTAVTGVAALKDAGQPRQLAAGSTIGSADS